MITTRTTLRALGLAMCALAVGLAAPAEAVTQPLRLASAAHAGGSQTRLVVVIPAILARQDVPASALHVMQDGHLIPARVQRVASASLDVYVVLDTTVDPPTFAAEQSAAADLLRNLPAGVRTATTTTDGGAMPVPSVEPGNLTALRTLAAQRPQVVSLIPERLDAIAVAPVGPRRRRAIVLLTDCRKVEGGDLSPLAAGLSAGDQQLDVIAPGPGCPSQMSSLAARTGGLSLVGGPVERLDQALDTVLVDLLGQYEITLPMPASPRPLTVTLDYGGVHSALQVRPAPTRAAPPRPDQVPVLAPDPAGRSRPVLLLLAITAAVILAATAFAGTRAMVATWRWGSGAPATAVRAAGPPEIQIPVGSFSGSPPAQGDLAYAPGRHTGP